MYETIANYLVEHAGVHAGMLIISCTAITMWLPTKLDGSKSWHKYYNVVVGSLNIIAGNILKNKNKDTE